MPIIFPVLQNELSWAIEDNEIAPATVAPLGHRGDHHYALFHYAYDGSHQELGWPPGNQNRGSGGRLCWTTYWHADGPDRRAMRDNDIVLSGGPSQAHLSLYVVILRTPMPDSVELGSILANVDHPDVTFYLYNDEQMFPEVRSAGVIGRKHFHVRPVVMRDELRA